MEGDITLDAILAYEPLTETDRIVFIRMIVGESGKVTEIPSYIFRPALKRFLDLNMVYIKKVGSGRTSLGVNPAHMWLGNQPVVCKSVPALAQDSSRRARRKLRTSGSCAADE